MSRLRPLQARGHGRPCFVCGHFATVADASGCWLCLVCWYWTDLPRMEGSMGRWYRLHERLRLIAKWLPSFLERLQAIVPGPRPL